MSDRGAPIYTDGNDDEPEQIVTRKNTTTGATEPATGLTGLSFHFAATEGGTAIHASLTKDASERGTTGRYYCTIEGDDITTQLDNATYWNTDIYQVFGDGVNINYNVKRKVLRHRP